MDNLNIDSTIYETGLTNKFKNRKKYKAPDPKVVFTNIPGTIIQLFVRTGQTVKKGDNLLILEAMKMNNYIVAPMDGKIKSVSVSVQNMVPKGAELIRFE